MMELDKWAEEYVNDEKTKKIFGEWAERIALNKGIAQGIEQNKIEIATSLLSKNISKEVISEVTGLSLEELDKLKTKG